MKLRIYLWEKSSNPDMFGDCCRKWSFASFFYVLLSPSQEGTRSWVSTVIRFGDCCIGSPSVSLASTTRVLALELCYWRTKYYRTHNFIKTNNQIISRILFVSFFFPSHAFCLANFVYFKNITDNQRY